MGYDILGDGEARLVAEKVATALDLIRKAHAENAAENEKRPEWQRAIIEPLPPFEDAQTLADSIDKLLGCFWALFDENTGDIVFQPSEDSFHRLEYDQWFFVAIGGLLDGEFKFRGEDGVEWRWDFCPAKGLVNVPSELVWGRDIKSPRVAGEIEDLIYDSATQKIKEHEDPQAVLDKIEKILRENGFGPFAGMDTLDVLVKATE